MNQQELGVLSRCPATPRRLLTVEEFHRMAEAGILTEDDRIEMIEGELVAIAPIGSEHLADTNALTRLLVMAVGDRVSCLCGTRYDCRGIPEVWIVSLATEAVEIYRSPAVGQFTSVSRAGRSGVLTMPELPDVRVPIAQIFA